MKVAPTDAAPAPPGNSGRPHRFWLLFCLFCLGLPLASAYFWFCQHLADREDEARQRLSGELAEEADRLSAAADTRRAFQHLLTREGRRCLASSRPADALGRVKDGLSRRFPGALTWIVLDGQGQAIDGLCDILPSRYLLKHLTTDLRALARGRPKAFRTNIARWRGLLGPLIPAHPALETMQDANYTDQRAYVWFSRPTARGLVIVYLNRVPPFDLLTLLDRCRRYNARPDRYARIISHTGTLPQIPFPRAVVERRRLSPRTVLIVARAFPKPFSLHRERQAALLLAVLAFLGGAGLSYAHLYGRINLRLSLSGHLLLLFLLTAALPLCLLAEVTRRFLQEKRQSLTVRLADQMREELRRFDNGFPRIVADLQSTIEHALREPFIGTTPADRQAEAAMVRIESLLRLPGGALIDHQGRPLPGRPLTDSETQVLPLLKPLMAFINQGRHPATTPGPDTTQTVLIDLVRAMSHLTLIRSGHQSFIRGMFPLTDGQGTVRHLAIFRWSLAEVLRRYLARHGPELLRHFDQASLTIGDRSARNLLTLGPAPSRDLVRRQLHQLFQGESGRGSARSAPHARRLLVRLIGRHLHDHGLVLSASLLPIEDALRSIRQRVLLTAAVLLLLSCSIGVLLAGNLLWPIQALAEGVDALSARRFGHRLSIRESDEFVQLSAAYNRMMESMADLEVARLLQERMYPATALDERGLSVFGACRSATQVGGDMFTYLRLPDNDILVFLGDVSGHGMGAAFVVAMVKGILEDRLATPTDEPLDPGAILDELNLTLLACLRRTRMMTCVLAVLRTSAWHPGTASGLQVDLANAGHHDPLVIRQGKHSWTPCEPRCLLVGATRRRRYVTHTMHLRPGDTLLLFSDGFTEAMGEDSAMIGLEGLATAIPPLVRDSARAPEAAIRAWHDHRTGGVNPEDDRTLLVVQLSEAAS